MPIRPNAHHIRYGKFLCAICRKPVILETAKTDDDGQAIHEECYVEKIHGKIPPKPKRWIAVGNRSRFNDAYNRRHADS